MIKRTNKPSIECPKKLASVMEIFRDAEVVIGSGKIVWTLSSAGIASDGGWNKEKGCYPSAIARLTRKTGNGIVTRMCHMNQIKLAK